MNTNDAQTKLALNSAHVFVQLRVAVYNTINIFANSRIAAADWLKLLPAHNNQRRIPL